MTTEPNARTTSGGGIGSAAALFLVLLVLKLTHVIDWSWWWVTAPLWGGLVLSLLVIGALVLFVAVRPSKRMHLRRRKGQQMRRQREMRARTNGTGR